MESLQEPQGAINSFHKMLRQGIKHAGLVDEGLEYFDRMSGEFGVNPKVEHYGCVVDL